MLGFSLFLPSQLLVTKEVTHGLVKQVQYYISFIILWSQNESFLWNCQGQNIIALNSLASSHAIMPICVLKNSACINLRVIPCQITPKKDNSKPYAFRI